MKSNYDLSQIEPSERPYESAKLQMEAKLQGYTWDDPIESEAEHLRALHRVGEQRIELVGENKDE